MKTIPLTLPGQIPLTAGIDLSDRKAVVVELDAEGEVKRERRVACTTKALDKWASKYEGQRIVLEAGTHSPWISRLLARHGFDVIVANPRKVQLISQNESKTDEVDAELLARLGRVDPTLLAPITHRSEGQARDMVLLRARAALVRCRTLLINSARSLVKSTGDRLPAKSAEAFHHIYADIPPELRDTLLPMLEMTECLTLDIRNYDRKIEALCKGSYPETALLRQVNGVGPVTALTYVLTIGDPSRFQNSRQVGSYLGLRPRLDQSGDYNPQLRITKAGDRVLRKLLVQCAHYMLGPFGKDSDLRRWGRALEARGGRAAHKRAVVATARKLAVLLHALWRDGSDYVPLRQAPG